MNPNVSWHYDVYTDQLVGAVTAADGEGLVEVARIDAHPDDREDAARRLRHVRDERPMAWKPSPEASAVRVLGLDVQVKTGDLDDDTVAAVASLFPPLMLDGVDVAAGEVYAWDGTLVEVIQGHTTQPDWTPDVTPALFKVHRTIDGDEPDVWVQPTGGHDAYGIGDRVTHEGAVYESKIDANTTVPGSDDRWWALVDG